VIQHLAADTLPASAPRHVPEGYTGVLLLVWASTQHELETAVYRPPGMPKDAFQRQLAVIYDAVLRYRGQPERLHRRENEAAFDDHFAGFQLGSDDSGLWGPTLLYPADTGTTLGDLTMAAVYDLRERMT
jgi:hypothetical protein